MVLVEAGSAPGARGARLGGRVAAALLLASSIVPGSVEAHERFVKHRLKVPLHDEYFLQGPGPLGINPDLAHIALTVFAILVAFMILWYLRQPLEEIVERRIARQLGGGAQRFVHQLATFLTDRPVRAKWFQVLREWCVILFLRSPGLVLMYSATNDSLVMPSYPLDPASADIFKFIQVGLAILILTQTALPLFGAMTLRTWIHLFRWGWRVALHAQHVMYAAA